MTRIGITERGDAGLDLSWLDKLSDGMVDGVIAITKDPEKLISINIPDKVVIHCTITGLGRDWEPNAPDTKDALLAYHYLVDKYGGDRIVLRVDPIIPYVYEDMRLSDDGGLSCAARVLRNRPEHMGRVRISFMDMYYHVRKRYANKFGKEFCLWKGIHAPLEIRQNAIRALKLWSMIDNMEVCGEPDIECIGCVSNLDLKAMHLESEDSILLKGQRKYCNCLEIKTELLSNRHPCKHNCLYCYWMD
jgi:DNA repair photolyase